MIITNGKIMIIYQLVALDLSFLDEQQEKLVIKTVNIIIKNIKLN